MRLIPVSSASAAYLLVCLFALVSAAPALARPASCSKGLFVAPDVLQRLKGDEGKKRRENLVRRVEAHRTRVAQPYTGTSAQAFMRESRNDLFAAMELALHAMLVDAPEAELSGKHAAQILVAWAGATMKGDRLAVMIPRQALTNKDDYPGLGLYVALTAMGVAHAYYLLSCQGIFSDQEDGLVKAWLSAMAVAIMEGRRRWEDEDYFGGQTANNHLSMHNAAIHAIGVATNDLRLQDWAISGSANRTNFLRMLGLVIFDGIETAKDGPGRSEVVPHRGEIYDRYRMRSKSNGLYYAFFHLLGLTVLAEAATNQGVDLYRAKAETGESLADAVRYYGEFLARHPCVAGNPETVRTGPPGFDYYANARVEPHFWAWIELLLFRLADQPDIRTLTKRIAVTACERVPSPYLPIPILFLGR